MHIGAPTTRRAARMAALVERLRERGARIKTVAEGRSIETVCGYNFVAPFDEWMPRFETLLAA